MPVRLTKSLKDSPIGSGVDSSLREYEDRYQRTKRGGLEGRLSEYKEFNDRYYDLVTDFYEYGWGRSFHFAPRVPGESFEESLVRHQRFLAGALALKPGMIVADLGSGVGGTTLEIARYSGAKIVGVNRNEYQIERARRFTEEANLTHLVEYLHCDFLNVDAQAESFDAVYSIEATCCAPDKISIYGEAFRLLKPGACFGAYEYVVTDRFDDQDPRHLQLKADIELGGGLLVIDDAETVEGALRTVGFEVLETRDLSIQNGALVPWYQPLIGFGFSLTGFRSSKPGRWITHKTLKVLETFRIAPKGAARVAETLNLGGAAMAEAGRLGIFTPMYFIHARKPE